MDAYLGLMKSAEQTIYILYIYYIIYICMIKESDKWISKFLMLEESSVIPLSWKALFISIWLIGELAQEGRVCTREHADRWQIPFSPKAAGGWARAASQILMQF